MNKNISSPRLNIGERLQEEDTFRFDCHPDVACFRRCCRDADMYLYPYDIIRMKNRLGMSSDNFLKQHTITAFRDNPYFPNVMLKMSDDQEKSCPFLSIQGCSIYEDRPFSCRAYPLERAAARSSDRNNRLSFYFLARHPYCLGHQESRRWTVYEWLQDQQLQVFNDNNDLWVDVDTLLRENPWDSKGIDSSFLKMAFMAGFNVDKFKTFVFESTFLSRLKVPSDRIEQLKTSDVELMTFGFDWIKFFLTHTGPLSLRD